MMHCFWCGGIVEYGFFSESDKKHEEPYCSLQCLNYGEEDAAINRAEERFQRRMMHK